jgi:serine/threonine protein kinase/Tol biopolymer transport system component
MQKAAPIRVQIGVFELDLKSGELRKGAHKIRLQEQPFQILVMLVERSGELVTRDEIKKKLWPNDTVVEFDHSIHTAINKLRQALGDSADQPQYVETVIRRGYRLLVPVEQVPVASRQLSEPAPATAVPPELQPAALTGRTVSHYRVLDIIGGGGMGVVYRAEDLKLGRQVALKFPPEELGSDSQALERFSREARAASSLDHPNICAIHEFGEHEGRPFMVMQLLEGQTLRDRLAKDEQALPLEELLDIGIQVSQGLQAAHEKGIIHRDIKPANIFLTSKGVVKILDFGLAKLMEVPGVEAPDFSPANRDQIGKGLQPRADDLKGHGFSRAAAASPAESRVLLRQWGQEHAQEEDKGVPNGTPEAAPLHRVTPADATLTLTGVAMGTAGYMSPEQVRGEKLDARTDIFSLGLVLYEMATGQRAFTGETAAVVHDAILNRAPVPARELNSILPASFVTVIDKALEKGREQRHQSAEEMGLALRRTQQTTTKTKLRWWLVSALAAAALCVVGFLVAHRTLQRPEVARDLAVRQLTPNSLDNPVFDAIALSPDGKQLAYLDRTNGLSLLQVDTSETRLFPDSTTLVPVTWQPDGDHLFVAKLNETGIWKMSIVDGSISKFRDGMFQIQPIPLVVSPDGKRVAFQENSNDVWIMDADGGNRQRLFAVDFPSIIADFSWSPTGQRLACLRENHGQSDLSEWPDNRHDVELQTCDLQGRCFTVLSDPRLYSGINYTTLAWLPDRRIVFSLWEPQPNENGSNLWSLKVNPETGIAEGEPKRLTNWTGFSQLHLVPSADGKRLVFHQMRADMSVKIAKLQTGSGKLGEVRRLGSDNWSSRAASWTPDGQTVIFTASRYGKRGIFKQGVNARSPQALVTGAEAYTNPAVTPDGQSLLYTEHLEDGSARLMRMSLSGGSAVVLISGDYSYRCGSLPTSFCALAEVKGGQIVFSILDPSSGRGSEIAKAVIAQTGLESYFGWDVSPDGKQIAFVDMGATEGTVRILRRDSSETETITIKGWGYLEFVHWSPDGNYLYVSGGRGSSFNDPECAILETDLSGRSKVLVDMPPGQGWIANPVPSPDGRHLIYTQVDWPSSVVMIKNF